MTQEDPIFTTAPRRALAWAFGLNATMLVVEVAAALLIASVALFADSMDFLEDALLYGFGLLALGWGQRGQARASLLIAAFMAIPGIAALMAAADKYMTPTPPEPVTLGIVATLALAANLASALLLRATREDSTVLKAAWLSARNDVAVNVAMIGVAYLVARWNSAWPDVIAGICIAALHGYAAWTVARSALGDLRGAA
jgi:Co/Zn/Cd efflux system component